VNRKRHYAMGAACCGLIIAVMGCGSSASAIPTLAVLPSVTSTVSDTPVPTSTPVPSATPMPSVTPTPPTLTPSLTITNTVMPEDTAEALLPIDGLSDRERRGMGATRAAVALPSLQAMQGVVASRLYVYEDSVSVEAVVASSFNSQAMAARMMGVLSGVVAPMSEFTAILQGDGRLVDYGFRRGEWQMNELTPMSAALVESPVTLRPTPFPTLPPAQMPTARPAVATPVQQQVRRPENCADAVAMGLTAVEAGGWDHLDRDNDGVACYGD